MKVEKVNAFVALMRPPSGEGLKAYLAAAVKALGGRSDAALARTMGVPPSTVAAWKRRGGIPDGHYSWFSTTLAEKIMEAKSEAYAGEDVPVAAVLNLLLQTNHNPWGLDPQSALVAAPRIVRELTPLAGFLIDAHPDKWGDTSSSQVVASLTELLEGAVLSDTRLFRSSL